MEEGTFCRCICVAWRGVRIGDPISFSPSPIYSGSHCQGQRPPPLYEPTVYSPFSPWAVGGVALSAEQQWEKKEEGDLSRRRKRNCIPHQQSARAKKVPISSRSLSDCKYVNGGNQLCALCIAWRWQKSIGRNISSPSSSSSSLLLALVLSFGISGKYLGGDTWRERFWGLGVHLRRRRRPSQSHNTRLPPFLLSCVIQGCIMCLSSSGVSWGGGRRERRRCRLSSLPPREKPCGSLALFFDREKMNPKVHRHPPLHFC